MPQKPLKFQVCDYANFLTYVAYAWCALCVPNVLEPLTSSLHFGVREGNAALAGTLALWRGSFLLVAMLGCTFIAGRWGKRISLSLAAILAGLATIGTICAINYTTLVVAIVLSALGQGVFEVLLTPLANEIHRDGGEPARYVNITHCFWSVGSISLMLLVGLLLQHGLSWRIVLTIVGCFTLLPGGLFFALRHQDHLATSELRPPQETWNAMRKALICRHFWFFLCAMPFASGIEHSLLFWMPTYLQSRWAVGPATAGMGTAIFAAGMFTGRLGAGVLMRQSKTGQLLAGSACGILCAALIALQSQTLALFLGALFLLGICTGPIWPGIQNHCLNRIRTLDQTTMLALLPTIGAAGFGLFPWLLGVLTDRFGNTGSFYLLPVCAAAILTLMALESRRRQVD